MAEAELVAEAVFLERSERGDYLLIYTSAQDVWIEGGANVAQQFFDRGLKGNSTKGWFSWSGRG